MIHLFKLRRVEKQAEAQAVKPRPERQKGVLPFSRRGMTKIKSHQDGMLLMWYEKYSEDVWCAGWKDPAPDIVKRFRDWLTITVDTLGEGRELEDYEIRMMNEFYTQEAASPPVERPF